MAEARATRTLTALYETDAAAERTIARLVEAGVPAGSIVTERASEAEVHARKRGTSKLMAALAELEMPAADRQSYERGLDRGGTLLVVHGVPGDLRGAALDIMDEDAIDLGSEPEHEEEAGAIGTMGGSGRAMGDADPLTGRPLDHPGTEDEPPAEQSGGYGKATGGRDPLTGRPTESRRGVRSY